MLINHRRVIGATVRTRSGQVLGRLTDTVIDSETGRISFLLVRGRGMLSGFGGEELRIAWSQIISIEEKEIVVTDATVPAQGVNLAMGSVSTPIHQKET